MAGKPNSKDVLVNAAKAIGTAAGKVVALAGAAPAGTPPCEVHEKREIAQKRQAASAKAAEESPKEGRCVKLFECLTN